MKKRKRISRFYVHSINGFADWTISDRKTGDEWSGNGYAPMLALLNFLECSRGTLIKAKKGGLPGKARSWRFLADILTLTRILERRVKRSILNQ